MGGGGTDLVRREDEDGRVGAVLGHEARLVAGGREHQDHLRVRVDARPAHTRNSIEVREAPYTEWPRTSRAGGGVRWGDTRGDVRLLDSARRNGFVGGERLGRWVACFGFT